MQHGRGADRAEGDGAATLTDAASTLDASDAPASDSRLPAPLKVRDRVRYEILGEHGRGGLGRVFRAQDTELGREIAIKELLARTDASEQRFFREALITARLEHPGIVPVHEAGRWPDGTPFYAMKLVSGEPLSELIACCQTADDRRALIPNLAAVAEAIAYAHEQRIIHRDLKPSNVIVGRFGESVVIDWGLAKDLTDEIGDAPADGPFRTTSVEALTQTGAVLGTPAYMAPEQARGKPVDERADVYALGAMLREILGVAPGRAARGAVDDDDLAAIARRATAESPAERYRSARQLVADLRAYLGGRRISARRYSLPATVRHWIAHHRAIAAAIAIATAITAIVSTVAIVRVVRARDHAERALADATAQRERALLAQARMLLAEDPTAAARLLDDNGLTTRDPVLAARLRAAGVAERSIPIAGLRGPVMASFATPGRYAVVTSDRTLHVVEVASGRVRDVDRGLSNPVYLVPRDDEVAYVARRDGAFTFVIARSDGTIRDVASLDEPPQSIEFDGTAMYALDLHDVVTRFDARTGARRELDQGVASFVVAGHHLYLCHRDGALVRHAADHVERAEERCAPNAEPRADGNAAVLQSSDDAILVIDAAHVQRVAFDVRVAEPRYEIATSGLIVAVDPDGNGLYLRPGAAQFEHVRFASARPSVLAASGSLAGWGFGDGTVVIQDTVTRDAWTLKTRRSAFEYLFLDASSRRAVTWTDGEIRVWSLEPGVARSIDTTEAVVFNAVPAPSGDGVLLDSRSGKATLLTPAGLVGLHQHEQVAFGAAWCGEQACTASWDGTVLCSDPQTHEIVTRREVAASVRWIASTGDDCVYASADGAIGRVATGEVLFRTDEEPRRVRVGHGGTRLVVADLGGNLVAYDLATHHEIARRHAHEGPAWDVGWFGDDLVSAGLDGTVRRWTSSLEPRWSFAAAGGIAHLAIARDRMVAISESGTIRIVSADGGELGHVELGAPATALAISPDATRVAVGTGDGEVLILRLRDLAIEARRVDRSALTCVTFVADDVVLGFSFSGGAFRIHLPPPTPGDNDEAT